MNAQNDLVINQIGLFYFFFVEKGTEREAAGLSSSNRGREEMYLRQYGGNMVSNNKQQQQQLECEGGGGEAGGEQQQQQPASRRRSVSSHPIFNHLLCMQSLVERSEMKLSSHPSDAIPRRYKTEYKKNFRPFSLYQYVDGQFCKASSGATAGGEGGGGSADHQQQQLQQQLQQSEKGDPWYHEVLELRKKAGEYKVIFNHFILKKIKYFLIIFHFKNKLKKKNLTNF